MKTKSKASKALASRLGQLGKGKPKTLTAEERTRRSSRMIEMNKSRTTMPVHYHAFTVERSDAAQCPKCGSSNISDLGQDQRLFPRYKCLDCGSLHDEPAKAIPTPHPKAPITGAPSL